MEKGSYLCQSACAFMMVGALIGCSSPTQPPSDAVPLDRQLVADVFGNHDGAATQDELRSIDEYFRTNIEAWCVSSISEALRESGEVSADQAKSCFAGIATRPFPDEQALRKAYESVNIKTPYVSIVVLRSDSQLALVKFFRSPGPGISGANWNSLRIK